MYRAKERGGARTELFDTVMRDRAVEALAIEQELQRAIEQGELRVYYQPAVDLSSGTMVGAEALVRWQHPERGLLTPDKFLDVAEETGLIVPLGAWVIEEACRRSRLATRPESASMSLSVNRIWHGDCDNVVPFDHSRYLARRIPGAQLTVMGGRGHLPAEGLVPIARALASDAAS